MIPMKFQGLHRLHSRVLRGTDKLSALGKATGPGELPCQLFILSGECCGSASAWRIVARPSLLWPLLVLG